MKYAYQQFYIPERMMIGLERYIKNHIEPGGFLMAILENNLSAACGRADAENIANLPAYVGYLYNEAPSQCHGSPEKVKAWLDEKNDTLT